jgi:hypothetical protein
MFQVSCQGSFRRTFVDGSFKRSTYTVRIHHHRHLLGYQYCGVIDKRIISMRSPMQGKLDRRIIKIRLLFFPDGGISSRAVHNAMMMRGCRPLELEEFLAFLSYRPMFQEQASVVSLGSVLPGSNGKIYVPIFSCHPRRSLQLALVDRSAPLWRSSDLFPCVRALYSSM